MARNRRNRYAIDDKKRDAFIAEGRGTGALETYKPWFLAQFVPTWGDRVEPIGKITKRVHQLLSKHEERSLYIYEFAKGIEDIQEQYPLLPLRETVQIAKILGIDYPRDPQTGALWVLTTDFLIYKDGKKFARTIKDDKDKWGLRMFEKFEIERMYWLRRMVDWGIIAAEDIPVSLAENLRFLREFISIFDHSEIKNQHIDESLFLQIAKALTHSLLEFPDASLTNVAISIDNHFGLNGGTGLILAYNLIANKKWKIDLYKPFKPGEIVKIEVLDGNLL